tara:strand:- start:982 stop:1674 length:693 start_codon:yes stop_codon:yes gene_type:complete
MTLNEIAYNLLNTIRAGNLSDDDSISLGQIKFNILHYRAMFIRRDYARNGKITRHLEQDLGCLELETVDKNRCCDGFQIGCKIAKTVRPLPKAVRFNFKEALTYIGLSDGMSRIQLIDPYMAKLASYAKFTGKNRKAFMIEDHLYILNADGMENVNIRGIFEDPREVASFDCDGTNCYDDDSPFPMPMDFIQLITQGMMQGELQLLMGGLNDTLGDTAQDRAQAPPQQAR